MHVLNTLAPLFLVVSLGAVLRLSRFVPDRLFKQTNRLVYWVGLPCLLFSKTAQAAVRGGAATRIFAVLVAGMAVCVTLGYLVGWMLRVSRSSRGAFVQGSYRGNLAYVGLPVILFALAAPNGEASSGIEIEPLAVLAIALLAPVYNAVAVVVLLVGRDHDAVRTSRRFGRLLFNVATNPLLLACAAGIGYSFTGWELPVLIRRTSETIGHMALPLALLGLGASLKLDSLRGGLLHAVAAAMIKVACGPLAGFLIGARLGLSPAELRIAMIYLATPTAVVSFVMAEQLSGDETLAGSIVVVTTLLSLPSLAVILLVT